MVDFFKDKIVNKIIYGCNQTFAIVDDGSLFSWGYNYDGQCDNGHIVDCSVGTGHHNKNQNKPQLVDLFKETKIMQSKKTNRIKSANSYLN